MSTRSADLAEADLWIYRAKSAPSDSAARSAIAIAKELLGRHGLTLADIGAKEPAAQDVVVVLVDESLSMSSGKGQTIEAVNAMITKLRDEMAGRDVRFSLQVFSQSRTRGMNVRSLCNGTLLGATFLTFENYRPDGNTPLYDAFGHAVKTAESLAGENPGKVVIAVQTDGGENCSVEFTHGAAKSLIAACEKRGWKIVFMGADLGAGAYHMAQDLGLNPARTSSFDRGNIRAGYASAATAMSNFITGRTADLSYTAADRMAMGDVWAPPSPAPVSHAVPFSPAPSVEVCVAPAPVDTSSSAGID